MKPIPAIVEPAQIDVALVREQIITALGGERDAGREAERLAGRLESARGAARARRLEVGRLLAGVRDSYPARGRTPAGKEGWASFVESVGLDERTALNYIQEFRNPEEFRKSVPNSAPDTDDEDDGQTGAKAPPPAPGQRPPFRELTADEIIEQRAELNRAAARLPAKDRKRITDADKADKVNLQGNSGDEARGEWCTPKSWAEALGPFDVDLFSNRRSHILAVDRCMPEDGGDGFGGAEPGTQPGLYLVGASHGLPARSGVAGRDTHTFFQWPYKKGFAERALAHHGHTRFTALLRLSPDPAWFRLLWPLVAVIAIPIERIEFEPPPGIEVPESTISYPHALYYACADDVTDAIRDRCIVLPVDHGRCDPAILRSALRLVE